MNRVEVSLRGHFYLIWNKLFLVRRRSSAGIREFQIHFIYTLESVYLVCSTYFSRARKFVGSQQLTNTTSLDQTRGLFVPGLHEVPGR